MTQAKRGVMGMKYISCIILAVLSSAATVWLIADSTLIGPSKSIGSPTLDISYSDFISLLLTVLAVILAALALGIGLIAFRTIGEIKREASEIAQEHSKSEVKRSLSDVPETISRNVEQAVAELLPKAIDEAVEQAGKAGRLDEALERAIIRVSTGGTDPELEHQPDSEIQSEREENDA